MLLYLASNLNQGLFDFIQDETIPIKKLSGEFNLKKFVIRDMRSFSHIRFLAIDHQALNDTDEEIVEGILGFRAMYDARIIYLAEGFQPGNVLLSKLYDAGVRNFVTAEDPKEIRQEILECISPEGMSYEKAERFKIQQSEETKTKIKLKRAKSKTTDIESVINRSIKQQHDEEFVEINETTVLGLDTESVENERKGITVAVAGIDTRTGTTTTALNLACFLLNLGAKVSYTECNQTKQLNWLPFFDIAINDDKAEYKGIYFHNMQAKFSLTDYDFNIFDLGKMSDYQQNLNAFSVSHVRIITATSKPYDLVQLTKTLELINDDKPVNLLFSFAADHERQHLRQFVCKKHKVYFTSYSPDLFDPKPNRMIWLSIMNDYVVAIPPEDVKKKKRLRVS